MATDRRAARHLYYKNHTAEIRAKNDQWAKDHPEMSRSIARRGKQAWRKRNVEKHKRAQAIYMKRWRAKNLAHARFLNVKWRLENPQKARLLKRNTEARRRTRLRNNTIELFSYNEILLRDGYKCHICGRRVAKKDVSFDHLIPVSKGGAHRRDNVAIAHLKCNLKRGPGRIPAQLLLVG